MTTVSTSQGYLTNVTNTTYIYDLEESDNSTGNGKDTYYLQNGTKESVSNDVLPFPVFLSDPGLMQLQLYVRKLHLCYLPTVYCLTLIGNLFNILILTDNILKKLSNTQYLMGILVVEIIHVLVQSHAWLEDNGWSTGLGSIGGWCQFTTFTTHITVFLYVWYTVFLSIDCYIRVSWPTLERRICTSWVAKIFMVGAAIVAIAVFFNISILYGTVKVGPRLVCVQLQIFRDTHKKLSCGNSIVNILIPTVLLLIFMALIIRYICRNNGNTNNHYLQRSLAQQFQINQHNDQNSTRRSSIRCKRTTVNHPPSINSTGFILAFLVVHVSCCMPLDAYHFVQGIKDCTSLTTSAPSLKGFLLEQILQYIKSTKCVLNVIVLAAAYPLFRAGCSRLPTRIKQSLQGCRRRRQGSSPLDTEVTLTY